jgi:ParB-like chromosome segregation protein Spo0J
MSDGDIRTRDETLATLAGALAVWSEESGRVLETSAQNTAKALDEARSAIDRRRARVSELASALGALPPDADSSSLRAQLQRAQESLATATRAHSTISASVDAVRELQRRLDRARVDLAQPARSDLLDLVQAVENYRMVKFNAGEASVGAGSSLSRSPSSESKLSGIYAQLGLKEVNLSQITFDDNPIIGEWGRGGLTKADYRWALETWGNVVAPGVNSGMTRDDFDARDQARHAVATRKSAAAYDMFLGSDPIRVDRLADGSHSVTGGRHRIEAARELGITSLPMIVTEVRK